MGFLTGDLLQNNIAVQRTDSWGIERPVCAFLVSLSRPKTIRSWILIVQAGIKPLLSSSWWMKHGNYKRNWIRYQDKIYAEEQFLHCRRLDELSENLHYSNTRQQPYGGSLSFGRKENSELSAPIVPLPPTPVPADRPRVVSTSSFSSDEQIRSSSIFSLCLILSFLHGTLFPIYSLNVILKFRCGLGISFALDLQYISWQKNHLLSRVSVCNWDHDSFLKQAQTQDKNRKIVPYSFFAVHDCYYAEFEAWFQA